MRLSEASEHYVRSLELEAGLTMHETKDTIELDLRNLCREGLSHEEMLDLRIRLADRLDYLLHTAVWYGYLGGQLRDVDIGKFCETFDEWDKARRV